jgi:hypothetical protein
MVGERERREPQMVSVSVETKAKEEAWIRSSLLLRRSNQTTKGQSSRY